MIGLINELIAQIGALLGFILNLLPDSPFTWDLGGNIFLQFIGWIIPIPTIVTELTAFTFAVAVYYGLRVVLRWIKASGS